MGKHKNANQDEIMLRFMQNHEDLAKGFTTGDKARSEQLWKELADELNASGPPNKDASSWKKVWMDWKASVRRKVAHNNTEGRATGGGPFNKFVLTKMEEDIGQLCGIFTVVAGIPGTVEFGAQEDDVAIVVEEVVVEEVAEERPSTSRNIVATPRQRETSWNQQMKASMNAQTEAMVGIATNIEKMSDKENVGYLQDIKFELKDANLKLNDISVVLNKNYEENKRHHSRMEVLKENEVAIKKRKIEFQEKNIENQKE